jgi:hypothetical protein
MSQSSSGDVEGSLQDMIESDKIPGQGTGGGQQGPEEAEDQGPLQRCSRNFQACDTC